MNLFLKRLRKLAAVLRIGRFQLSEILRTLPSVVAGIRYAGNWRLPASINDDLHHGEAHDKDNPLRTYFLEHRTGRGIWKWNHYFEVYNRHCKKLVGRDARVLEIGVYSGGSLDMWKSYFGARSRIYGVDIEKACTAYEGEGIAIHIGDQEDRSFWQSFKAAVPVLDVVIDDGGHLPEQQIVTFEELLPHLRPGGVYICEDVHGIHNRFSAYVSGLVSHFHSAVADPGRPAETTAMPTAFQSAIQSIHIYPFVVVVERNAVPVSQFVAPKHGTEWQPFL